MKPLRWIAVLLLLVMTSFSFSIPVMNADDEVVDKIFLEDPAELGGKPNDIHQVYFFVDRHIDANGEQIRVLNILALPHTKFLGTEEKPFGFEVIFKWTDEDGREIIVPLRSYFYILEFTYLPIIDDNPESPLCINKYEEDFKIAAVQIMMKVNIYDTKSGFIEEVDSTDWTDLFLDVSDNRVPKTVENVTIESLGKCVILRWKKPEIKFGDIDYDRYNIYRNDEFLKTVTKSTMFSDCQPIANEKVKYTIKPYTDWRKEGSSVSKNITYESKPIILCDKDSIDFGVLDASYIKSEKFTLKNKGTAAAEISFIENADWFDVSPVICTIEPEETREIELTIVPNKLEPEENYTEGFEIKWDGGYIPLIVKAKTLKDNKPPEVEINPLEDVYGADSVVVSGKTEPGSKLKINGVEVAVEDDGSFSASIAISPAPSKTQIKVWSSDRWGNYHTQVLGEVINILKRTVILNIGNPVMTVDEYAVAIDPPPTILSGRTMVPIRAVAEAFGANVNWDGNTRTVFITFKDISITLPLGSTVAFVNSESKAVDPPAQILKGRTMVPFRFISEALGASVEWEAETKKITIKMDIVP
ncbi:MAG TPA: stalk domain-containing protein [Caldisericia bacterium]|nr:stalk domain-containing protein [Caldisericia bacterium]HPF49094.1 stalk domain-containing protein [Caldisericia bacterium]HPI83042.1 stalk domain-containing protein [Caldisericia bacterium]HPQ92269.1 stalk domain-containing protein [Caldisericia bacterium]HRV74633.1 stalk domain-containing protein [Caldisericia bacterium]